MNAAYRTFFALQSEPFSADIALKDILVTAAVQAVQERMLYSIRLGAVALLTGEIGSGKSTALRYVTGNLHPSAYRLIRVTATSGSILERLLPCPYDHENQERSAAVGLRQKNHSRAGH
jgi:general secretion pathway protein A